MGIVIVMGFVAWHRYGSATSFTVHSMIPSTHLNDIIFWSVLTFAFGGCETASLHGRRNQECAAHDSAARCSSRRSHGHDLLHPGNGLRAAGAAFDRGQQPARIGAGRVENRVARGISRSSAAGRISDRAQQHWRGRSLSGGGGAAAVRRRARSLSAAGVRSACIRAGRRHGSRC